MSGSKNRHWVMFVSKTRYWLIPVSKTRYRLMLVSKIRYWLILVSKIRYWLTSDSKTRYWLTSDSKTRYWLTPLVLLLLAPLPPLLSFEHKPRPHSPLLQSEDWILLPPTLNPHAAGLPRNTRPIRASLLHQGEFP